MCKLLKREFMAMIVKFALLFICLWGTAATPEKKLQYYPNAGPGPEERVVVTSDRIKLQLIVAGEGPPCIFLHGGPGQGSRSFRLMGGASLERLVRDIGEVRLALGLGDVYVLSHSVGGILAVNYAARYPSHLKGLMLVNSSLYFYSPATLKERIGVLDSVLLTVTPLRTNNRDTLIRLERSLEAQLLKSGRHFNFLADQPSTLQKMQKVDNYERTIDFGKTLIAPINDPALPLLYPEYYRDHAYLCPYIPVPTLIVTGTRDYAVGTRHYLDMLFPRRDVRVLEGAHLLYYEQNNSFRNAVLDFVSRNGFQTDATCGK